MTQDTDYCQVSQLFKALSNPLRLRIVHTLVQDGCRNVSYLEQHCQISQSCVSQHLQKLRAAQVVCAQRVGQEVHYRICDPTVEALVAQCMNQEVDHGTI